MKRLLQYLLVKEKALWKSATMWLAALLLGAPEALNYARDHWIDIAPNLPPVLQAKGLGWVSLAIFLCRMKSLVKIPPAAALPAPDPNASRP